LCLAASFSIHNENLIFSFMWLVFALAAAIIWGINYAASGRVIERGMSPLSLFFLDLLFGLLVIGGLMAATGRAGKLTDELHGLGGDVLWLGVAMAASTSAGLLIFFAIGEKNATVASLIEISYPLFVAFFAWLLFRESQLNWPVVIGGAMILGGVLVVWSGYR
jgi:drug/metabolite transporter (DMT)-like permease